MSAGSIRPRLRPESASKVRPPSNLCRGHLPRQGAGAYFSGADGFTGRRSTSADLRVVARANFHTNPRDRRVPEPSVCSCFPSQPDPRISSVWHVWWQRGRPGQLRAAKGPASSSSDHVRISPALHLGLWQSPAGRDAALVRLRTPSKTRSIWHPIKSAAIWGPGRSSPVTVARRHLVSRVRVEEAECRRAACGSTYERPWSSTSDRIRIPQLAGELRWGRTVIWEAGEMGALPAFEPTSRMQARMHRSRDESDSAYF
jgi:hypothetical protein